MLFAFLLFTSFVLCCQLAFGGFSPVAVPASWGVCGVSHHTPARYLTPARNLPQRDSLFWLFLRGLDMFSLHGSYFSVLAVPQLWPLPRMRSIVQILAL
jgi:hypothetical protein